MNDERHGVIAPLLFALQFAAACVADGITVIRPPGTAFDEVVSGMRHELGRGAAITEIVIDGSATASSIARRITGNDPVVVMDNRAIALYAQYQSRIPDSLPVAPVLALMAIAVEDAVKGLRNTAAISYEVPAATSVAALRSFSAVPLQKIGVVHRPWMTENIRRNREYCMREEIQLVARETGGNNAVTVRSLSRAIRGLLREDRVDALWIPNDNLLLTSELLRDAWIPEILRHPLPVIVGVEILVDPLLNFGTFAVVPELAALGAQAAGMLQEIRDSRWPSSGQQVRPPISVYKVLNMRHGRTLLKIKGDGPSDVDKIVE